MQDVMVSVRYRTTPVIILAIASLIALAAVPTGACTTVIAGREATANGSVIVGHNEDNPGRIVMTQYVVPRMVHEPGEEILLKNGGTVPQAPVTWSFIWSQTPGDSAADFHMNEWGVMITSNNCAPTKEDDYETCVARGDITDGGIGYHLRRIVAQRATTAREGLELAIELISTYGYVDAGRSYQIADANEAWFLHVVRGKHYVAQRVPDDMVVAIPNTFIIHQVDLEDTENFRACPDLREYAIERAWYDPSCGEPFDFAKAYGAVRPDEPQDLEYDPRQWSAQRLITGEKPHGAPLPFAVKPSKKIAIADIMGILRDHYEGTHLDMSADYMVSPHWANDPSICMHKTQESFVVELRDDVSDSLKAVYWRATGRPCTSPYIPWHIGITSVPEGYGWMDPNTGYTLRFEPHASLYDYDPSHAWWVFRDLQNAVDGQYGDAIELVQAQWRAFEKRVFAEQPALEQMMDRFEAGDEEYARDFLTRYTNSVAIEATRIARELTDKLLTAELLVEQKRVRLSDSGSISLALLGSETFDASEVSYTEVAIGPAQCSPYTWAPARSGELVDVNGDGSCDLVMEFAIPDLAKLVEVPCYTDIWLRGSTMFCDPVVARTFIEFRP
jgi:dipeptidase